MKKLLLLIFLIGQLTICKAQQFSFQMNFVDAVGNKDSLVLGYDTNGTDTMDASFVEINIIASPLDTVFDVRVTDELYNREWLMTNGTFHTKKQIVTNHCGVFGLSIIPIDIYSRHFPVTASWDSTLFIDTCRNGSLFTGFPPGGWWDAGGISDLGRIVLKDMNQITFTSQVVGLPYPSIAYINNSNDTISTYWLAMYDSTILFSSVGNISISNPSIKVFPNPTYGDINLQFPFQFGHVKAIEIYSPIGQLVMTTNIFTNLSLESLESGVYFVVATNDRGEKLTARSLKI